MKKILQSLGAHECTECRLYQEPTMDPDEYRVLTKYGYIEDHFPVCKDCGGELQKTEKKEQENKEMITCATCGYAYDTTYMYSTRCPKCYPTIRTGDGTHSNFLPSLKGRANLYRESKKLEYEARGLPMNHPERVLLNKESKKVMEAHNKRKLSTAEVDDINEAIRNKKK